MKACITLTAGLLVVLSSGLRAAIPVLKRSDVVFMYQTDRLPVLEARDK